MGPLPSYVLLLLASRSRLLILIPGMSQFAREDLLLVDWNSVRMLSIDARNIHIVTEKDGARDFKFDSEEEARRALDEWMLKAQRQKEDASQ